MNRLTRTFQAFTSVQNLGGILAVLFIWALWSRWMHPWALILGGAAEIVFLGCVYLKEETLELYISHSEQDAEFVKSLSLLLQKSCGIPADLILCQAYDSSDKTESDPTLPVKVRDAKAYIALLTLNSERSQEIVFELGARWGAGKQFSNVYACGAHREDVGGPLSVMEPIQCREMGQIFRLIHEVSQTLDRKPLELTSYVEDAADLMELSRRGVRLQLQALPPEPIRQVRENVISAEFFRKG